MAEQGSGVARRERGMTPYKFTLAAGVARSWDVDFDYFHVLSAPVNDLQVRFDEGPPVPLQQGVGLRVYGSKFTLESATGQTVTVLVGFGHVFDARASANVSTTVNVSPGNTFDDGGDVEIPAEDSAELIAADPDRLYVNITNPSDSAGPVRIGSSSVDGSHGRLLEPGVTAPFAFTGALYAYNPNDAAVTLSVDAVREVA